MKEKIVKVRRGVYRLGDYEVWCEGPSFWRIWWLHQNDGKATMLSAYPTLREAIVAVRHELESAEIFKGK